MSKRDLELLDDLGIGAWDNHKPDAFVELLADDFVLRDMTVPEPIRTREAAAAYAQTWLTAFPDMRVRRTNRVIGEDSVAGEIEFTGTNTGPLSMGVMQLPATGKSVVGRGAYFVKVKDGKVTDFSSHPDAAGLMVQLGLMPQV
jgi:steroid delta-isomerase-like uncharacterized protein